MTSVNFSQLVAELVEAVLLAAEDEMLYVNRLTGQSYTIAQEEVAILAEVHDDMFPEIEVEIMDEIREVLGSEDWLELPSELNEAELLERFCETIAEVEVRNRLLKVVKQLKDAGLKHLDFRAVGLLEEHDLEEPWRLAQKKGWEEAIATYLTQHQVTCG